MMWVFVFIRSNLSELSISQKHIRFIFLASYNLLFALIKIVHLIPIFRNYKKMKNIFH